MGWAGLTNHGSSIFWKIIGNIWKTKVITKKDMNNGYLLIVVLIVILFSGDRPRPRY